MKIIFKNIPEYSGGTRTTIIKIPNGELYDTEGEIIEKSILLGIIRNVIETLEYIGWSKKQIIVYLRDELSEIIPQEIVIGKNPTGLSTPRFRLMSGDTDPLDLAVVHYKDLDGDAVITDVYKVIDILNEYVDEYHQKKSMGEE